MNTPSSQSNRLNTARLLFDQAEGHLTPPTLVNRFEAVIGYAAATELLLKAVADKLGIQPKKKDFTIHELVTEVDGHLSATGTSPLRKSDILKVAEIRNLAIHHGIPPSEEGLTECRSCARQFLVDTATAQFAVDFLSLTQLDFIKSEKARRLLGIAQRNIEADSYNHSRVPAKLAFQIYLENYMALMPYGPKFQYYSAVAEMSFKKQADLTDSERIVASAIDQLHRAVSDEIEETRALLGIAVMGHSLEKIRRYDSIASRISFRIGAVAIPGATGTKNTDEEIELSRWFISFITQLVLQMEQTGVSGEPVEYLQKWYDLVVEADSKVFS